VLLKGKAAGNGELCAQAEVRLL